MSDQRAWEDWYLQHKRRWPLDVAVLLGVALALWTLATGHGARVAAENLPRSVAELDALQPTPLDEDLNAAALWRQAVAAYVPSPKPDGVPSMASPDLERLKAADFHKRGLFAVDGILSRHLAANRRALDLAGTAAHMPGCDWEIPLVMGMTAPIDPITDTLPLSSLLMLHGVAAADANRWAETIDDVQALLALADHHLRGPNFICFMIALSTEGRAQRILRHALGTPGARPSPEVLASLLALAHSRLGLVRDGSRHLAFERASALVTLDRLGAGDPMWLEHRRGDSRSDAFHDPLPPPLNPIAALYGTNRGALLRIFDQPWPTGDDGGRAGHLDRSRAHANWAYRYTGATVIAGMIAPSIDLVANKAIRQSWEWRVIRAGLEIHAWSSRHGGTWPTAIEELGLPGDAIADPWLEAGALRFGRCTDGALRCWSVGRNGKDDSSHPAPIDDGKRLDDIVMDLTPALEAP